MALAAIPVGMSVLGGAMSMASGFAQAGAYRTQAAQYQQQERMVALQAKTDEANRLTQLNQAIGTNHALMAAGNVSVDSPTSQALDNANRDLASRSITYSNLAAQVSQQRMAAAASSDEGAAKWAIMGGFMKGAQSIYGGFQQAGMIGGPSGGDGGMGSGFLTG